VNTEFQKKACPAKAALPELFKGLDFKDFYPIPFFNSFANLLVRE